jgi:hypothetical protein
MLKNVSNLGTLLSKQEQQTIHGGFVCYYWDLSSLEDCISSGSSENVYCDPTVECEPEP